MLSISALLYGGVSICGIISINLPIWPGVDKPLIYAVCTAGILLAIIFYLVRKTTPLWLVVLHIPLGTVMLTIVIYAAHAPQSVGIALVYVVASTYTFHYLTRATALSILAFAMVIFGYTIHLNQISGMPAMVFFLGGCCVILGEMVRITVGRLNHLAVRDNLTGLLNRNTIDALTTELLHTSNETGKEFTFILLDLNKFKAVNDNKGHLKGDEILKKVGSALTAAVSELDYTARWGGDEFIIVLHGTDINNEKNIEINLRKNLENTITFEMGATHSVRGDTLDDLVKRADTAMYKQKNNRRSTDKN